MAEGAWLCVREEKALRGGGRLIQTDGACLGLLYDAIRISTDSLDMTLIHVWTIRNLSPLTVHTYSALNRVCSIPLPGGCSVKICLFWRGAG